MNPSPAGEPPRAPRPLRFRLFLLAASGLVPLALVLLFAAAYLAGQRRMETERSATDLARAMATAVDAELRSTIALLQNLAVTAELGDLAEGALAGPDFLPKARRMAEGQGWAQINVADSSGRFAMTTAEGPQAPTSPVEPQSLAQVIATGQPVVGPLARRPQGRDAFAVRVPVFRENRLRYVLTAVVPSAKVLDVLARQQVTPSWVVGVFDQDGNRIARSRATSATRYSPTLEQLVRARGKEGAGITRTVEGDEVHTGFSRVLSTQWIVAVAIPTSEANADLYRLLAAVSAGTAASLALLAWLAWRAVRYITGPIEELKAAATRLGSGQQVTLPPLGVLELDEVGAALRQAAGDRDDANARKASVEAEREELLGRVEHALQVAEQANRNKDEFLALLGHELRNPLAPITNALHLMELKGDPATERERGVIQRQLTYVTRLVDDLLDAARINSKRLVMNLQPLQLARVVEQTVEAVRPSMGRRRLRVVVEASASPLWVRADEARLVQILNNLLGNAIKFTRAEGTIEVAVRSDGDRVAISIADDGAGMTADELGRAFDIFYQAPIGSREVNGGLGLGLAIVKSLVEMHGGAVGATSGGPGQGTTVTLSLPVVEAGPHKEAAPAPSLLEGAVRVLVVDDNEDAAMTLAAMLEISGFTVQAVFTPEEAIASFEAFGAQVAVLDIGLPRMDGYELVGRLLALCGDHHCKFVALTGYGQEGDMKKALAAGFDAHLTKPADPEQLLQLLASLAGSPKA